MRWDSPTRMRRWQSELLLDRDSAGEGESTWSWSSRGIRRKQGLDFRSIYPKDIYGVYIKPLRTSIAGEPHENMGCERGRHAGSVDGESGGGAAGKPHEDSGGERTRGLAGASILAA